MYKRLIEDCLMKNALLIVTVLFAAIMSTACINNFAVQELNNKAQEYIAKGDYDAAIGRLEASIDIDPTIFETNYNLGIAAISAEKYEKAIIALNKAAELKPDNADVYYSLAVAQYNFAEEILEGDTDKEVAIDTESAKKDEKVSTEVLEKANSYYLSAIKSLEKCLACSSVDAETKATAESQLNSIKNKVEQLPLESVKGQEG